MLSISTQSYLFAVPAFPGVGVLGIMLPFSFAGFGKGNKVANGGVPGFDDV
jgi:hypothetical protein